jgi:hypothetical protein
MTGHRFSARKPTRFLSIVAAAGCLAACGGTGVSTPANSAAATGSSATRTALTACLKSHGVTLPSGTGGRPGPGGGGPPRGTTGSAGAGPPTGATGPSGAPPPAGGGKRPAGAGSAANPKLRAALQACGASMPTRPAAGGE